MWLSVSRCLQVQFVAMVSEVGSTKIKFQLLIEILAIFRKSCTCQLTSTLPSAAGIVRNVDQQLFHAVFNPIHCLNHMMYAEKNTYGRNLRAKGHGLVLLKATTDTHKNSFFISIIIFKYFLLSV